MKSSRFHACATCMHFKMVKSSSRSVNYHCSRLGYETKPHYKFNCWQPKGNVIKLMKKEHKKTEDQP